MKPMRVITVLIPLAAAVFHVAIMCVQHMFDGLSMVRTGVLILHVVAPLVFTAIVCLAFARRAPQAIVLLIGATAISALGVFLVLKAFYFRPHGTEFMDDEPELVPLLLPFLEWIGGVLAAMIAALLELVYPPTPAQRRDVA